MKPKLQEELRRLGEFRVRIDYEEPRLRHFLQLLLSERLWIQEVDLQQQFPQEPRGDARRRRLEKDLKFFNDYRASVEDMLKMIQETKERAKNLYWNVFAAIEEQMGDFYIVFEDEHEEVTENLEEILYNLDDQQHITLFTRLQLSRDIRIAQRGGPIGDPRLRPRRAALF